MNAPSSPSVAGGIDSAAIEGGLRSAGYSSLGLLLEPDSCHAIAAMYDTPAHFRSRIQMAQYRFGRGEYQYFSYPLPPVVAALRTQLYVPLAEIAARWTRDLGMAQEFPARHTSFLKHCHASGQTRPTPLLLRYRVGDFNCLHHDIYGEVVFPFQVIIALSRPEIDYEGGELLLVEQQPRAQWIGRVIRLRQGEAVVITTRYRPVQGARGYFRTNVRHGVSELRRGERFTLGIIFHDGK